MRPAGVGDRPYGLSSWLTFWLLSLGAEVGAMPCRQNRVVPCSPIWAWIRSRTMRIGGICIITWAMCAITRR